MTEERDALIAAFRAAPGCVERWCEQGRKTLVAWQAAVAAKVPSAISAGPIECSAAGCFLQVTVAEAAKFPAVNAALPDVIAANNWPGPMIQGGPDLQTKRGSVISIWAILPVESNQTAFSQGGVE